MFDLLTWWVAVLVIGIAALPITNWLMRWIPARGYAFSKIIGLLLVSYILWIGATARILTNDRGGCIFSLLLMGAISAYLLLSKGWDQAVSRVKNYWSHQRWEILTVEALILLTFTGWAFVRAYSPDKILPAGGEKYMEIAFLNGILNSSYFPPADPWLAGYGISYYYFGYLMMGFLTHFTGSVPTVGFDLYDALLFSLSAVGAYGVTAGMVFSAGGKKLASRLAGLLGALFVTVLGNLQGLVEGLYFSRSLPESFWQWLNIPGLLGNPQTGSFYPGHNWWWWRASRVLNDLDLFNNPVVFQPIDEFPFFSFLLGDNHPHKMALPFVLLCIGLALNLLLKKAGINSKPDLQLYRNQSNILQKIWSKKQDFCFYGAYAFALGSLGFLNTWDMPIYLAVFILAYFIGNLSLGVSINFTLIKRAILLAVAVGSGAIFLYFSFYLGFSSQAGGVLPYIFSPTRLTQYLVMFAPFVFILTIFTALTSHQAIQRRLVTGILYWQIAVRAWLWIVGATFGLYIIALLVGCMIQYFSDGQALSILQTWFGDLSMGEIILKVLAARLANPWLFIVISSMIALAIATILSSPPIQSELSPAIVKSSPIKLFALMIAITGLGLTLIVEFFYLRDLFGMRMNTVFKFYYQGWLLMGCASAFAVWWIHQNTRGIARAVYLTGTAIFVAAGMVYPVMAIFSRTEGFVHKPVFDAAATIAGVYPGHWAAHPEDYAAIQWINENIRPALAGKIPIILEAPGGAYEHSGRISAFTGLPTLLGWANHEGQWRGNNDEINLRLPDIQTIYTTSSGEKAIELLRKWHVQYVIVGEPERQYISRTCNNGGTACKPDRALDKFNLFLIPIYSQQGVTVYSVP